MYINERVEILSKKRSKLLNILVLLSFLSMCFTLFYSDNVQAYEGNSKEVEDTLKVIIKEYGEENIIFDDGIVLTEDEKISLSELSNNMIINWQSRDSSIVKKIGEDTLMAMSNGTTFLVGEENGNYHIREVYVASSSENSINTISNYNNIEAIKRGYLVYLDPGHGGSDPGSSANGIIEKELNLKIALKVKATLENMGIAVQMSRDTDKFVSLADIAAKANSVKPDVFVSIHQNSFTESSVNGIETYWYKNDADKQLATGIQNRLISSTGATNRGVKREEFYVIKNTSMPSVLVECGFITNPIESNNLRSEWYQNKIVESIVNGTYEFLKNNIDIDGLEGTRIFGKDRYETSYEVFKKGWGASEYAILAPGYDYADALCAAPLATKYNAPILLAKNDSLKNQPKLLDLLKSKGVKNIFIVGGTGVIPSVMETELLEQGINVKRLGGIDRYETSVQIAQEVGSDSGEIALASGLDFADGLSISPIAAKQNMPILLTLKDTLPDVVLDYINTLNIKKSYVIGANGAISDDVARKLSNAERLGGKNRYETNKVIFDKFKPDIDLNSLYISSGLNFPDALSISALAGKDSNFLILSNLNIVEQSVKEIILDNKESIGETYILGSSALIKDNVLYGLGIDYIR